MRHVSSRASHAAAERESQPSPRMPAESLISVAPETCRECWGCIRLCPSRAIRVVGGTSEIIAERCVKCGLCVSECSTCGHVVRDDLPAVRELLAGGRPVVAVLASEYVAALHPMTTSEVERALESAGFHAMETTVIGEELVATEYESALTRPGHAPRIRSTCPVATAWVRKFHPQFTEALVPVVPPYIAQARLVKKLYPEDCAIVYVSPCFARKDEIFESSLAGAVDAAIDFAELRRLIDETPARPVAIPPEPQVVRPQPAKEISLTDGFPRRTLESYDLTDSEVVMVRGLREFDELLCAIERGELAPAVIDVLNCEGCIDGPAVNPRLSVFSKRNIEAAERDRRPVSSVSSRALLGYMPEIDLVRVFRPEPIAVPEPTEAEVDAVLAEGEFTNRSDVLDCGACGYPTCVGHAVAILNGVSTWEMCFPLQRRKFQRETERLEAFATIDEVTGLWNRRVFAARLSEEAARSARYGSPLSLVMLDLDDFKDVNDEFGHPAGDTVLEAVGELLKSTLRESDVPIRYGGDEFAVILPGITKTEAFVVAEKLRERLAATPITVTTDDRSREVRVTASLGVASAGARAVEALSLLEAADSALYQAKASGRNQVRLAVG
jgi:diguanylate cyclase (GGDEF)-like protein